MPARVRDIGREQAAEVAEPGRPEERVADRMERDVAVGVADQPRRAVDRDAAEPERHARAERMASCPMPVRVRPAAPSMSAACEGRRGASP